MHLIFRVYSNVLCSLVLFLMEINHWFFFSIFKSKASNFSSRVLQFEKRQFIADNLYLRSVIHFSEKSQNFITFIPFNWHKVLMFINIGQGSVWLYVCVSVCVYMASRVMLDTSFEEWHEIKHLTWYMKMRGVNFDIANNHMIGCCLLDRRTLDNDRALLKN